MTQPVAVEYAGSGRTGNVDISDGEGYISFDGGTWGADGDVQGMQCVPESLQPKKRKVRRSMEHKIVFATSNAGKMREIREILKDLGAEILSMKEAGVDVDIVEDGDTFAANALIKAKAVWEKTGGIVLADDSGLVIDALNGGAGCLLRTLYGRKNFL